MMISADLWIFIHETDPGNVSCSESKSCLHVQLGLSYDS